MKKIFNYILWNLYAITEIPLFRGRRIRQCEMWPPPVRRNKYVITSSFRFFASIFFPCEKKSLLQRKKIYFGTSSQMNTGLERPFLVGALSAQGRSFTLSLLDACFCECVSVRALGWKLRLCWCRHKMVGCLEDEKDRGVSEHRITRCHPSA